MKIYLLNRTVIKFQPNATEFLRGLTSNSLDKPQNAFLNIHGKIIATFSQIKINDDEFWIVLETPFAMAVLEHLDRYARLSGAKIEKLNKNVYFDLEANVDCQSQDVIIPQKRGRLILSDRKLETNVSEKYFTLFRLQNNIPVQGIDYREDFLLNVSEIDHVSFAKGCFLGQEPISKVHNRSKPSWKLVVKHEDECSEEENQKMTSKISDPATQKTLGFVFVKNED